MSKFDALAETVVASTKAFVLKSLSSVTERLSQIEASIAAIPAGPQGEPGPAGADGVAGPQGEKGDVGPAGEVGPQGEKGEPGLSGKDGAPGLQGEKGEPGFTGAEGPQGEKGEQGLPGKDGAPGPRGEKGEQGFHGAEGESGPKGDKGEQGLPGKDGSAGLQGEKGLDGRDGRDGKDGIAGKDAFEIDILPSIVEGKSYPRGTLAQWGGGLIRATRNTDEWKAGDLLTDAGWTFLVRGLAAVDVVQKADERTFDIVFMFNDGEVERKAISIPTQLYRGIWKEGTYTRGDTVTLGGCSWHCERETSSRPGTNEDWRMSVKKGTDGKDGKPGEKGERGLTGRAGKDLTQLSFSGVKT